MYQFRLYGLIAALAVAGCGEAPPSTADVIDATTAHLQPLIDTTLNVCRTARAEIERHGGDPTDIIRACEAAAAYARMIRDAQNAACALDPGCE